MSAVAFLERPLAHANQLRDRRLAVLREVRIAVAEVLIQVELEALGELTGAFDRVAVMWEELRELGRRSQEALAVAPPLGLTAVERSAVLDGDEGVLQRRPARIVGMDIAGREGLDPSANPGAVAVDFLPHLIPMTRGILSACHVRPTRPISQPELDELYAAAYADEPFVTVVATPPATRHTTGSNHVRIHVSHDERTGRILAIGVEDNLVKGAAGQAIQSFNIVHGLPETAGLEQLPLAP